MTTTDTDEPAAPPGDGGLVRCRLDLAYDGTEFSGWARQHGQRTVEQTVVDALCTVLRLPAAPALTVAGRTDAGVHATGQVVHTDLPAVTDAARLARRLNGVLPGDVVVRAVSPAPPGFDARFAATGRRYRYRVSDRPLDPLRRHDTVAWGRPLQVELMDRAASALVGEHDFAAYCRPRPGATTIRHLKELQVARDEAGTVVIEAYADAFCHHQVRWMVGALLAVGDGRRDVEWPRSVLDARTRDSAVTVAPPQGLTLVAVDYPPDDELAARVAVSRNRRA